MAITAKAKLGKFACRVGYLHIRQRMAHKRPTEVFVCHGRHVLTGPFTDVAQAKADAERCISEGIKHDKFKK